MLLLKNNNGSERQKPRKHQKPKMAIAATRKRNRVYTENGQPRKRREVHKLRPKASARRKKMVEHEIEDPTYVSRPAKTCGTCCPKRTKPAPSSRPPQHPGPPRGVALRVGVVGVGAAV